MFPANASLVAGTMPLFEDKRSAWAIEQLKRVQSKHIVELGPQARQTYILEKHGCLLQLQQLKQTATPT